MINRLITDIFDKSAELYQVWMQIEATASGPPPDFSDVRADHLVTPEEKANPALFYAPTDRVPDITFQPPTRLPLISIHDGEYQSAVESPFPENNTVHVRHYRLAANGPGGPTVIMIPGWKMDDYSYFDLWCWRFAAWGLNSILINIPYHMRRTPKGAFSGQLLVTTDTTWNFAALKQSYLDIMLLANWLRSQGSTKLGVFGVSYGGYLSGMCVTRAPIADFAILGMPPMDTIDVLATTEFGPLWRNIDDHGRPSMLTDPQVRPIFDLAAARPLIPNEKIFIAMGVYDKLVPHQTVRRAAKLWGGLPWLRAYPTGHINTFALNFPFMRDARHFIRNEVMAS